MREAVVHEVPRRRWVVPAVALLAVTIIVLTVFALVAG